LVGSVEDILEQGVVLADQRAALLVKLIWAHRFACGNKRTAKPFGSSHVKPAPNTTDQALRSLLRAKAND
jgi:hypothetical protein